MNYHKIPNLGSLFKKDPVITFEKVYCDFCREPTGSESKCNKMKNGINPFLQQPNQEDGSFALDENHSVMISGGQGVPLSIFSNSCLFRRYNLWRAFINYPFTMPLAQHLSKVEGLESVIPIGKYSFQFVVGRVFSQDNVKKDISIKFKTFIKEMQADETLITSSIQDEINKPVGIKLPNGQQFIIANTGNISPEQLQIINEIKTELPDSKMLYDDQNRKPKQ